MSRAARLLLLSLILSGCARSAPIQPITLSTPEQPLLIAGRSWVIREVSPDRFAIFVYHPIDAQPNWQGLDEAMMELKERCARTCTIAGPFHAEGDFFTVTVGGN